MKQVKKEAAITAIVRNSAALTTKGFLVAVLGAAMVLAGCKEDDKVVAVTSVTLAPTTLSLFVDSTAMLTATIVPDDAANKAVTWSVSPAGVVNVSNTGLVTALAAGMAVINVTTADGSKKATCTVTVTTQTPPVVSVSDVTLAPTTLSLVVGGTSTLTATITPYNATNMAVTWSSSDTLVAKVSALGVVTALAAGSATITVTTDDGGRTAECAVSVNDIIVVNSNYGTDTIKLVHVAGGTYTMGCDGERDGGSDCLDNEKPSHSVTLNSFKIGKYEVTQKLWQAVMGSLPSGISATNGQGDNYPVYYVNWDDVQTFLTALNTMTGRNFRLPTEAEWEYAARGGSATQGYMYSGSNLSGLGDVAWFADNAYNADPRTYSHTVDSKAANELGIYGMTGNVFEWCSDWFGDYSSNAQTNPTGAVSGTNRVIRGGGWSSTAPYCRVAFRSYRAPASPYNGLGLRLVLPVE